MTRRTATSEAIATHADRAEASAAYFTAVRGFGANRTRVQASTIEEAEAIAASHGDGRTMIYAVSHEGGSAHLKNA